MSTIKSSTTSTTAYSVVADTTGTLVFQTGATPTTAMTLGTDQSVTFAGTQTYTGAATFTSGITVQGLTVGKGAGAVATNTAVGASALAANTSGNLNTAVGREALLSNTTGSGNSAFGEDALVFNTTGGSNTALGDRALFSNTTASNNTAVGYQAGYTNSTGIENVFLGSQAGYSSNANGSVYVGYYSGQATTGYGNTFIGNGSGYLVTSGTRNTILGKYNGNQGGLDIRTASNYIVLSDGDGNPQIVHNGSGVQFAGTNPYITSYTTSLYAYGRVSSTSGVFLANNATSWASTSDERRKDIIEPITNATEKLFQLRTVIGKFKVDVEGTRRPFLIAQDVLAVFPEAVSQQEDEDGEFLGMSYTDMIPLLVAAIQELKAELDTAKAQIAALQGASA